MDYRTQIPTYVGLNDRRINVVCEIPNGTVNKYEIDEVTGEYVKIVRTLSKKYPYIYNYGFIPQTLEEDGDQLDAIIIADEEIAPLTVLQCSVIGVIKTIDNGEQDDKILVIPTYSTKKSINLKKILKYLRNYKYPNQKGTEIGDVLDANEAYILIDKAMERLINSQINRGVKK